jgi:octaprenyl-diphosphate synthase
MTGLKEKILSRIEPDLERIEKELNDNLKPHLELVAQTAGHLIFSGGKRLRPLLTVLCARLCGRNDSFVHTFSIITEYLHTATLLHDDVVDGADIRRGRPAAHSVFGPPVAVLVGDFLLARALDIAARAENPKIIRVIAEITENMCQGEIQQLLRKGDTGLSEAEYMEVIERKTGFLIQGACQTGAILADAPAETEKQLTEFGRRVGLVFQIADDLLDYTAETAALGKAAGTDLREGKLTLPMIHVLEHATEDVRERIKAALGNQSLTEGEFRELVKMIDASGGIQYARDMAGRHVESARRIMEGFPPGPSRETLLLLAEYALNRSA